MINKERVRKWVEALRSGMYIQSDGALYDSRNDGYCCLGVACEISGLGDWTFSPDEPNWGQYFGIADVLPEEVYNWYGFKHSDPEVDDDLLATQANDDKHMTFNEIADLVEKRYLR